MVTCVICPTFSSMLIWASRSSISLSSALDGAAAGPAAAVAAAGFCVADGCVTPQE
ncbi:hypothetical protein [Pontibacter beigongshangensis]|uniref:hypothetical protein n=1 Tax=Pontibacter beigongshangensis TaxID=2574733 RepID=UPI001F511048|nr:hypothetical protein [Pontibacter beigongshangensis]